MAENSVAVDRKPRVVATPAINERAQSALAWSPIYELRSLQVESEDGRLVITGAVSSFYHKQLAQELVRTVAEHVEVVNKTVVPEQPALTGRVE